jgi:broad specificity phosphatase PhoE
MRVSDLARAKETAQIIHDNLGVDMVEMADPDELLNEGR